MNFGEALEALKKMVRQFREKGGMEKDYLLLNKFLLR